MVFGRLHKGAVIVVGAQSTALLLKHRVVVETTGKRRPEVDRELTLKKLSCDAATEQASRLQPLAIQSGIKRQEEPGFVSLHAKLGKHLCILYMSLTAVSSHSVDDKNCPIFA